MRAPRAYLRGVMLSDRGSSDRLVPLKTWAHSLLYHNLARSACYACAQPNPFAIHININIIISSIDRFIIIIITIIIIIIISSSSSSSSSSIIIVLIIIIIVWARGIETNKRNRSRGAQAPRRVRLGRSLYRGSRKQTEGP